MPDTRKHRGLHPDDPKLFASDQLPVLARATADLSWLLGRGYAPEASLKMVGDHFQLKLRQRQAIARGACSDDMVTHRKRTRVEAHAVAGQRLHIDGFNVLTTLEVALSGGIVLRGRDGCLRDIASVHGTWRRVEETPRAIALLIDCCRRLSPADCQLLLDRPVSNSGRLSKWLAEEAERQRFPCDVRVVPDPDRILRSVPGVTATSDREVLAGCQAWFNLVAEVVAQHIPDARVVAL